MTNYNSSNRSNSSNSSNRSNRATSAYSTSYASTSAYSSSKTSKPWAPKPERSVETVKVRTTSRPKNFMDALNETENKIYGVPKNFTWSDKTFTENGAVVYSTSGHDLLDMNFAVSQLRGATTDKIVNYFRKAFAENPEYAMRWLFYCRDCRGGLGERHIFTTCLVDLANNGQTTLVNSLVPLIADYGYFKDLLPLLDTKCSKAVTDFIAATLKSDLINKMDGKSCSLLAKWLPSLNASSSLTMHYANIICKALKFTPRNYRKTLSKLRKYVDVVERKMSSGNWDAIDYEKVPSKANLNYNNAFLKHDEGRRRLYLNALTSGEAKINASVLMPHDIAHKYCYGYKCLRSADPALEGMWNALPDYVNGNASTLVVSDGSGSMTTPIGGSTCSCLEVSVALAIYFAQKCRGAFHNKYITFGARPKLVTLPGTSLHDDMNEGLKNQDCSNTNIEATFDLILKTAMDNHMSQEDLPANVLIISDMQFDSHIVSGRCPSKTLFDEISFKFMANGYKMPKLVFWNVLSRNLGNTIPLQQNDMGVILVSGYSPAICKMVLSGELDPYMALIKAVMDKRYDPIGDVCKKVWSSIERIPRVRENISNSASNSRTYGAKNSNIGTPRRATKR